MIRFERDEYGDLIEHEPHLRPQGGQRLFLCSCDKCGKSYRFHRTANVNKVRCSCESARIVLTHDGETLTLPQWLTRDPTLKENSIRKRLSEVSTGKANYTDTEILYGKRRAAAKIDLEDLDELANPAWQATLVRELNKHLASKPLVRAVILAVKAARLEMDFNEGIEQSSIFTKEGLEFEYEGQTLLEMLDILGTVELLRSELVSTCGVRPEVVESFFQ